MRDCTKARVELGWKPEKDAMTTLSETIYAARVKGLVPWRARSSD
jgi:nucleoside-diphosphate-sugar epimerase